MSNPVVSPEELSQFKKLDIKKGRLRLKNLYKTHSIVMHNMKASKRDGLETLRDQYYTKMRNLYNKGMGKTTPDCDMAAWNGIVADLFAEKAIVCGMHTGTVDRHIDILRRELRHIHLARAFNYGTPYRSVETKANVGFGLNPEPTKIVEILREHVPAFKRPGNRVTDEAVFKEQVRRVQEWLKGEDKVVINTTHGFDANGGPL